MAGGGERDPLRNRYDLGCEFAHALNFGGGVAEGKAGTEAVHCDPDSVACPGSGVRAKVCKNLPWIQYRQRIVRMSSAETGYLLFELRLRSSPLYAISPNEIDNTLNPLWLGKEFRVIFMCCE